MLTDLTDVCEHMVRIGNVPPTVRLIIVFSGKSYNFTRPTVQ